MTFHEGLFQHIFAILGIVDVIRFYFWGLSYDFLLYFHNFYHLPHRGNKDKRLEKVGSRVIGLSPSLITPRSAGVVSVV